MEAIQLIKDAYTGIHEHMIPMLLKTPEPALRSRTVPTINPVIWQAWHILRTEDMYMNTVMFNQEQVFHRGSWKGQLGISTNHVGTGMTTAEADSISQAVKVDGLIAYNQALKEFILEIIDNPPLPLDQPLDNAEVLEQRLQASDSFPEGTRQNRAQAYASRERSNGIIGLISHGYMHLGQYFAVTKPL